MGFRLVPKSVTLNDLKWRNDRYLAFFSPNSVALGADYVKWSHIDLYSLRRKSSPKNLVVSDISFMAIFEEVTENERIIDRHLRDIHPLFDYNASKSQSVLSI